MTTESNVPMPAYDSILPKFTDIEFAALHNGINNFGKIGLNSHCYDKALQHSLITDDGTPHYRETLQQAIRHELRKRLKAIESIVEKFFDGLDQVFLLLLECPDSPNGKHEFEPDLEHDGSGKTINCAHCGEPAPENYVNPWTDALPTEPGRYWYLADATPDATIINIQRWKDCAPANWISMCDPDMLVAARHYDDEGMVYDHLGKLSGVFCPVEGPPPLPERFTRQ